MDGTASYIFVIVLLMACVEAVTILSLVKSRRDDSVSKVLSLVNRGDNSVSKEVAGLRDDIKALLREIRELKEIRELRRESLRSRR